MGLANGKGRMRNQQNKELHQNLDSYTTSMRDYWDKKEAW